MPPLVDTKDISAIEREVRSVHQSMFPGASTASVAKAFRWVADCFEGRYPGYLPIDARYHDLEHTLQGTACMIGILNGRYRAETLPQISRDLFGLGLLAILLHDTGYLKKIGDSEGTGAKYTLVHVRRSMDFAGRLLGENGYASQDVQAVQNMISCTGVNVDLANIPFQSQAEKIVGFALGTGDLLGQMAADDYVDKLPILFEEFAEAQCYGAEANQSRITFASAEDLLKKTPGFWHHYVKPRIADEFQGLYRYLADPYPDGQNLYLERIEANVHKLQTQHGASG